MNLKQIAQKLGGYIQSKTQDDEGWFRQGKFTPVQQAQQIGQNIGQTKLPSGITLKQLPSAYMSSFSQSRTLPEKLMNIGTSSFLKASTFGLLQPQAPKAETLPEKFFSGLGGLTGFVGPGSLGGKAMTGLEKVGQAGITKFAPTLQRTLLGKAVGGLGKEAIQTAGYIGGKYLSGKVGLRPEEKITGKSVLQDLALGAAMRGITTPGIGGMVKKAISPDVWTSDRMTVSEAMQRIKVGETIDEFSKTGKAIKNMYKEYGLASYPNWNKLSQSQQISVLSDRLDEMARSGFGVKMGIYGGKEAQGYKPDMAGQFSNMADKKVRFEIDDSKAKLKDTNFFDIEDKYKKLTDEIGVLNKKWGNKTITPQEYKKLESLSTEWNRLDNLVGQKGDIKLKNIFSHDELYQQYPEAQNIKVKFSTVPSLQGQGSYDAKTNILSIDKETLKNNPDDARATILHEIQHAIQTKEGFAKGGNLNSALGSLGKISDEEYRGALGNIDDAFQKRIDELGIRKEFKKLFDNPSKENIAAYDRLIKSDKILSELENNANEWRIQKKLSDDPYKAYQRLSGEIESRDVSARMDLTPEQRARTQPYVSQGIPQNEWITKFDDNTSLSSPIKTGGDVSKISPESVSKTQNKPLERINKIYSDLKAGKYTGNDFNLKQQELATLKNTYNIPLETTSTTDYSKYFKPNLSPESKGTIKLKDNDLVKTFDKTVKTTETPKVKVRGFTESVQETPKITKGTKVKVAGEYTTKPNDVLMGEAKALLNEGVDLKNINRIENIDQKIAATIQEAINLDAAGKHEEAAALFNNLSELGTQVGRGTQAFSLLNKMSPEAISLSVAGKIKKYNLSHNKKLPELTGEQQKQLSKQVNEALKLPVGSKERGIALGKVNETINSFIPSTFADKFITVWKAGLLSSLRTHERNIVGNVIMQGSEQASLYPAAGADWLMSKKTGTRTLVPSQKGSFSGAVEGGQTAADVIKYGFDPSGTEIGKYETKKVTWGNNPLEQSLKKATDTVFNTLEAEDKVFWKSSYNRSLYNQAAAQAINDGKRGNAKYIQKLFDNATEEMKQTAFNDANYATFKDKNMLSGAIGQYKSWVNRQTGPAAEAGKIVSEMLMPFTGVPTSIVGKTVAYSPIGLVKGSVDFGRVVAGSEVPGLQRQAAQEIGRGVIGSGIFGLGAYLMSQGLMTGQAKDQKERDQWALEGKQENSIFVNGKWRSINSVGPQTLVLLAGAKANETANDPEQNLGTYGFSTLNDQLNQTFLSGVQQPLAALNEPYKAKSYLGGQVASLVPNIVKDTSKAFDPLKREVDTSTIGSSIKGRVQQSIPGLRNKMIPQRDVLGNEIAQTPTGIGAYFDLFNSTTPISNTVVNELSRLNTAGYNKTPTKLDKNQTIGGEKMTLNQAQLDRLEIVSGLATDKALNDLFNTTAYQSLNDAEKQDAIGDTITKVRKNVRANIDLSNIQEKSYVKSSDSQLTELGGFNLFTKSVTTDPKAAMNALLTGNPIRKISDGNIVVLERENDVGSYDLGDTTSQVDHAIPLSLGGTNEVRNLQILSNEEHAIKTKTDMYLLDQVQSSQMSLKEAQEKAKNWRDTALSLPKDAQSQMIDEIDSESPDKQSDGSQVYKLVSDTGNVTLVDLGTPIKQPEYTGFDAIDKKLKSSYKSAITKRINNIVKLYEDGQLSAKEANKLIGELNTQYSSGTGTKKKSKKKITFKVTSPKALPKITLKISSPVSSVKLKSAPKIKLSKTDNRKYTIKA